MASTFRGFRSGHNLCDEKEDLMSSVQSLKERINLTEQTLSSLSSSKKKSSPSSTRSAQRSPKGRLTLAELHPTSNSTSPHKITKALSAFRFSQYKRGSDAVDAPFIATEVITTAGGDDHVDTLKSQLHKVQQNYALLETENGLLKTQLADAQLHLKRTHSARSIAEDDIDTYKTLVSQLQETIVSLESQVKLQDNAMRKGEQRHAGYKQEITDGSKRLKQCSDMLKLTEERMLAQQNIIKSLRLEKDRAVSKAEQLESTLAACQEVESRSLSAVKEDLQRKDEETAALLTKNKILNRDLSQAQAHLGALQGQCESQQKELSHLVLANETLNERIAELSNRVHSSECEVIEVKTLNKQNTDLHQQLSQLKQQLLRSEETLNSERHQKYKEIDVLQSELKAKAAKVNTLEDQFGLMEAGLLQQKQRMAGMEADLLEIDQVKMENIELKCKLEESERKLAVCQQEMLTTTQQLGKLENLATRIESRENLGTSGAREDLNGLRLELREKTQEVGQLQASLEDCEAKLRLAQLTTDARDKIQKKSDKLSNSADRMRLQSEVGRLKSRLSEGDTKCEMLQSRLKELQTDLSTARRKLETSIQTNKNLKQQKSSKEQEIKVLKGKMAELEKSVQLSTSQIEDQHNVVERLHRQISNLKRDLNSKSTEKQEHVDNLQQQCEHWQQQVTNVQRQKDGLKLRLNELQAQYTTSQETIIKLESQLELRGKEVSQLAQELEVARSDKENVSSELSCHVQTSEVRMEQLESTLAVTREECEALTKQMYEEKSLYERHLSEKDEFIKEYQNRLKVSQVSLKEAENQLSELQQEVQAYRQTGSESKEKVRLLEQQLSELNSQVLNMEQTLKRVGNSHQRELAMLNDKLKQAVEELEQANMHRESLSTQVADLRKDKNSFLSEVESLESKLTQTTSADKCRLEKVNTLEIDLKNTQDALRAKEEDVMELEARLQKMEIDLEHNLLLNTQFEGEFRRAQNDLKSAMDQCNELQDIISNTREDKKSSDSRVKELERSLRKGQEQLNMKVAEVEELEVQVASQEKQLLSRAQQVSQLDVTINSYKNSMELQLRQTTEQLEKCRRERNERSENLSRLHDKCTQLSCELDIRSKELSAAESLSTKLKSDLQDRSRRVSELESRLDGLEEKSEGLLRCVTSRAEEIDAKNELIKRYEDQVDRLKFEVTEATVERETLLERYNHTKNELQEYLDTVYRLEQRLSSCEQSQAGKVDCVEEAKHELEQLQQQHKKEIARLEEAQTEFQTSKERVESSYQSRLNELQSREIQLTKQLHLANEQIQHLRDELHRRLQLVKNANEAVVIKEAEIARLQAKVSGIERRWAVANEHVDYSPLQSTATHHLAASSSSIRSSISSLPSTIASNAHRRYGEDELSCTEGGLIRSRSESRVDVDLDENVQSTHVAPVTEETQEEQLNRIKRNLFPQKKPTVVETAAAVSNSNTNSLSGTSPLRKDENRLELSAASDTLVSHDDTLAREREELFNRLDELNQPPASQHNDENGGLTSQYEEQESSSSESLSTVRQGPPATTTISGDGTEV